MTWGESDRRPSCHASITLSTSPAFEVSSKRRKGYPSETNVKRGLRFVRGRPEDDESVELVEKLGRNDPCPCGSGTRFQSLLPKRRPLSTGRSAMITGGSEGRWLRRATAFLTSLLEENLDLRLVSQLKQGLRVGTMHTDVP